MVKPDIFQNFDAWKIHWTHLNYSYLTVEDHDFLDSQRSIPMTFCLVKWSSSFPGPHHRSWTTTQNIVWAVFKTTVGWWIDRIYYMLLCDIICYYMLWYVIICYCLLYVIMCYYMILYVIIVYYMLLYFIICFFLCYCVLLYLIIYMLLYVIIIITMFYLFIYYPMCIYILGIGIGTGNPVLFDDQCFMGQ